MTITQNRRARVDTCGTTHLTLNEFHDQLVMAMAGETIVYATGDLGHSCSDHERGRELQELRAMVWNAYLDGKVCLTQRRLPKIEFRSNKVKGGASFEYLATKRAVPSRADA